MGAPRCPVWSLRGTCCQGEAPVQGPWEPLLSATSLHSAMVKAFCGFTGHLTTGTSTSHLVSGQEVRHLRAKDSAPQETVGGGRRRPLWGLLSPGGNLENGGEICGRGKTNTSREVPAPKSPTSAEDPARSRSHRWQLSGWKTQMQAAVPGLGLQEVELHCICAGISSGCPQNLLAQLGGNKSPRSGRILPVLRFSEVELGTLRKGGHIPARVWFSPLGRERVRRLR